MSCGGFSTDFDGVTVEFLDSQDIGSLLPSTQAAVTPSSTRGRKRKSSALAPPPTPWQEKLVEVLGVEEDESELFGRRVAALHRRLPKRQKYRMEAAVGQVMQQYDCESDA